MHYVLKKIKYIIIGLALIILSGCSSIPVKSSPIITQEVLLERCSTDTPIPLGKDGKALIEALVAFQKVYNECAVRHDKLIDTIEVLKNTKEIKK